MYSLRRLPQGTRNDSSEEEEEEDDDDEEGYDSDLYDEYDDDYHGWYTFLKIMTIFKQA